MGITTRVMAEAKVRPNIMEKPSGPQNSFETVIGIMPTTVVMVVRTIGCRRADEPCMVASLMLIPFRLLLLILSIRIMASFTTIPARATTPIMAGKLRGFPTITSPINTPIKLKGIVVIMKNGWRYDRNWRTRTDAISITARIIALNMSVYDCCRSSASPPIFIV